jgi:hypothetical protein
MAQQAVGMAAGKTSRVSSIALVAVWLAGLGFVVGFALPYFNFMNFTAEKFGPYWPKRVWLWLHIGAGMVPLLIGPFALRLGLARRRMELHRKLGVAYMAGIAFASAAAFSLALNSDLGWVFSMGLTTLNVAWLVTTGMALAAIKRRQIQQHQEWMIRSYVVTFGFVNFRILVGILTVAGVGSIQEQLVAASWFAWSFPLVVTEAILQGRKIFASNPAAYRG